MYARPQSSYNVDTVHTRQSKGLEGRNERRIEVEASGDSTASRAVVLIGYMRSETNSYILIIEDIWTESSRIEDQEVMYR